MTTEEKIERSKSSERIDFDKIGCERLDEPLVPVEDGNKIMAVPRLDNPGRV